MEGGWGEGGDRGGQCIYLDLPVSCPPTVYTGIIWNTFIANVPHGIMKKNEKRGGGGERGGERLFFLQQHRTKL